MEPVQIKLNKNLSSKLGRMTRSHNQHQLEMRKIKTIRRMANRQAF
jgi:hypothetical protein